MPYHYVHYFMTNLTMTYVIFFNMHIHDKISIIILNVYETSHSLIFGFVKYELFCTFNYLPTQCVCFPVKKLAEE